MRDYTEQKTRERELSQMRTEGTQRYLPKIRVCFSCPEKFTSTGPHHRMCPKCRLTSSQREGLI